MLNWILRRSLGVVAELLLGLLAVFLGAVFLPNSPLYQAINTSYLLEFKVTFHGVYLDSPIFSAFKTFFVDVFTGDWGISTQYAEPVTTYIASLLPWTLLLIVPPVILTGVLGSLIGVVLAQMKSKALQSILNVILVTLNATPVYVIGTLVWIFLAYRVRLFPTAGNYSSSMGVSPTLSLSFTLSVLYHYALPILTLWLSTLPNWALYMRAAVVSGLSEDYLTVAKARGIKGVRLRLTYVARPSLLPVIANVPYTFSTLISGAVYVEQIFTLRGLGSALYSSLDTRDVSVILSVFAILVLIVILGNYVTDITYSFIDPRIKEMR